MKAIRTVDQASSLRRLVIERGPGSSRPPVVAVASGKGGVGKTLVSVNLALRLTALGKRVLLIDLDAGLANVDVQFRIKPRYTVQDVLAGNCEAEEAVLALGSGLLLVPGGSAASGHADFSLEERSDEPGRLLGALRPLFPHVDAILLDTGAGLGAWVLAALRLADQGLIVTQPDPASVTDAYALLKVLRRSDASKEADLIINRVRDKEEALLTAARLRGVAKRFLGYEPGLAGWLREAQEIQESVRTQSPFARELAVDHPVMQDLSAIAAQVAGRMRRGRAGRARVASA